MASTTNETMASLIGEQRNLFPYIIFRVLIYMVSTTIIAVNGSILAAFLIQRFRRPNLTRLSPAGLLVLNLLASDGFVGGVTVGMTASETSYMAETQWVCSVRLALSYLALIGSHVALINVALDRYIAIMHTLHYRDWMTMGRSVTMVCCGWLIPAAGAVAVFATNDWRPGLIACEQMESFRAFLVYVWVPSHVLAFLGVIVIQCRVYLQLKRHESFSEAASNMLKNYSRKSVQVLFSVSTTFVVCWGPFDVVLLIIIFWPNPILKMVYDTSVIIAHFAFLVNPCIYSYKTENIRKPVSALCKDVKMALFCNVKAAAGPQLSGTEPKRGMRDVEGGKGLEGRSRSGTSVTRSTSLDAHGHI